MAKSVASRDARYFATTRAALALLIARGETGATGKELFGDASRDGWGRNLLQRMVERGLVTVLPREGTTRVRTFVAVEALKALAEDDQRISALMWPSGKVGVREEDVLRATKELAGSLPAYDGDAFEPDVDDESVSEERSSVPPIAGAEDIERLLAGLPPEEVIPTLVKLCSATLQNVVYMRQRVDKLITEFAKLREAWE